MSRQKSKDTSKRRSKGRRYDTEPKLNMKKVFAVAIAFAVIIMFIFVLKGAFSQKENTLAAITTKSYFSVFKDEKWGVIDSEGNIVIDPSYKEMMIIPDKKEDVFLCTYDVDYNTGTYKTKVLNSNNEEILKGYEMVEAIANKSTSSMWYEKDILKVKKDGKYGTINLQGKELLPIEYEEIEPIIGIENSLKIKKDGKYGITNDKGKIILEPKYSSIAQLGDDNKSGYIVQDENGKYGIVDYSANTILKCEYDAISKVYQNEKYVVTKSGKQIVVDKEGKELLNNAKYDEITGILKNEEGVIYKKNQKYGIMKITGEDIITPTYDELKEAKTELYIMKKNGKFGIIDMQNNEKIAAQYTNITYQETANMYIAEKENFESDIIDNNLNIKLSGILLTFDTDNVYIKMRQNENVKYYNFNFEEKQDTEIFTNQTLFLRKQDGKYGFVDKEGNIVVDYQYEEATEPNEYGYAGIKKDGKWGSIDRTGKVVQEPTYNLDNYLLVDFIGKWHLGEDLNMNYYNQL